MTADSLNISPLIKSKKGVHISIYLPRPTSDVHFKNLLEATVVRCVAQLGNSLSEEKIAELLGPIKSLMNNPKMVSSFGFNIAIFRTTEFLRMVSLPIDIDFAVHVADSFHVKPLLSYLNQDYQYLFFGSDGKKGYLYKGNKKSYHLVDEFHFHSDKFFENDPHFKSLKTQAQKKKYLLETNISWVEQVIASLDKFSSHSIFISANVAETKVLQKTLKSRNLYWRNVSTKFTPDKEKSTMQTIQKTLDVEKTISFNISLNEFKNPAVRKLAKTYVTYDINEISKAAKKGKIKKLLIASDAFVFGKLDEISGEVTIREADMDHTDDDLLDDIAQNVFRAGGEVLLVQKKLMPDKELIAGIVKEQGIQSNQWFRKEVLIA
jgi:hypothetical protein